VAAIISVGDGNHFIEPAVARCRTVGLPSGDVVSVESKSHAALIWLACRY
jgi:hypothetical protein